MFRTAKNQIDENKVNPPGKKAKDPSAGTIESELRYPKPKVLLLDTPEEASAVLRSAGYNITTGTFGAPYEIPDKSDSYRVVRREFEIPNYAEQEIGVIDLSAPKARNEPAEDVHPIDGDYYYWGKCNLGVIDPRPAAMAMFQKSFDRIVDHGGVFIVFADDSVTAEVIWAKKTKRGLDSSTAGYDLWSFLSMVDSSRFTVSFVQGSEIISYANETAPLGKVLRRHLKGASFTCSLEPKKHGYKAFTGHFYNEHHESWLNLASNKYGAAVSGVFLPHHTVKGAVFIFPRLVAKGPFLIEFFRDVLPEITPNLFPYAEPNHWRNRDEYEMPAILTLKQRIEEIRSEADAKIGEIEANVAEMRAETAYLMDLLSQTGAELVVAVKKSFEILGFESILDVDEEIKGTGEGKREDLRIQGDPTVLIEVKGIVGLPTDADALQVQKYVMVRMREWKRTNVHGLEIINHQKSLPPLDRDHRMPFRQDVLVNAEEQQFGLMTTWDLYRLMRSFLTNGWRREDVKPIFFRFGRIQPVPVHYHLIGRVEHYWERPGAVGISIESDEVNVGDRIAFELPASFQEQQVESLQVEDKSVATATAPAVVGIKTRLTRKELTRGVHVFRVGA